MKKPTPPPSINGKISDTFLVPVIPPRTTSITLTALTREWTRSVSFIPISPAETAVVWETQAQSNGRFARIRLGILKLPQADAHTVKILRYGEVGGEACDVVFGSWRWTLGRIRTRTPGAPWYNVRVNYTAPKRGRALETMRMGQVPKALSFPAPPVGGIRRIRVAADPPVFITMQELPTGESRWFYEREGCCIYSGRGFGRDESSEYSLHWRNAAIYLLGATAEICVLPNAIVPANVALSLEEEEV